MPLIIKLTHYHLYMVFGFLSELCTIKTNPLHDSLLSRLYIMMATMKITMIMMIIITAITTAAAMGPAQLPGGKNNYFYSNLAIFKNNNAY